MQRAIDRLCMQADAAIVHEHSGKQCNDIFGEKYFVFSNRCIFVVNYTV